VLGLTLSLMHSDFDGKITDDRVDGGDFGGTGQSFFLNLSYLFRTGRDVTG
jgi:hypothetical protein